MATSKIKSSMSMAEQDDLKSATLYDAAIKMLAEAVLLAHNVEYTRDSETEFSYDFVKEHFMEHNDIISDIHKEAEVILTNLL